jgi:Listeria-Bacteroides repeat domain (List_Bact_rpt)
MSFTVTYNSNGNNVGTLPVAATYADNAIVAVQGISGLPNPVTLSSSNGPFVDWNTAANGSGTSYQPGATFPITANVTLYAQWLFDSGLTNAGVTTNFQVEYPNFTNLPAAQLAPWQANVQANANYLLSGTPAIIETAFTTTTGWFGTDTTQFGPSHRQQILLDLSDNGGAYNNGYGNPIHVDGQYLNNTSSAGPIVAMVWMNEWVEVLMSLTNGQWNAEDSSGEGLSQYSGSRLFSVGYNAYYGESFVNDWLNGTGTAIVTNQGTISPNAARSDWVNTTFTGTNVNGTFVHGDGDPVSIGCSVGFLYYLTVQLQFTINQVIASYNGNLASCYHTLSGDSSDPFPLYAGLLASVYPVGTTASITGSPPNNPFPIAEVQFYMGQNTFGKDEMQDVIDNQGGLINQAFWVVVTGFSQFSFKQRGITVGAFTGAFADLQTNNEGVTITANPAGPQFENGVNSTTPQTIRIPYDITFSNPVLAKFPGSGVSAPLDLSVTLTANGSTVSGSAASTQFEFIAAGDPYFNNVDSTGNQPYLSQDLRVFPAVPAINNVPFPNGPTFANDSVQGAYDYIQKLLHYLNTTSSFTNPAGTDPLTLLPFQGGEGQTDSSVAPYAFDFSGGLLPGTANSYSFAIARVRLRGIGTASSPATAQNVRVFFRLFGTQTNDTTYDPTGTYASQADAAGQPGTPLVGADNSTIPFFATGNPGAETDYQNNGVNNQTLVIPSGQNTLYGYYGCFLNLYDPNYKIGGQQIQAYLHGTHHCLVAQIAYDDAPIPTGVSPLGWDQLAQRNLQFTTVDNPGPAAAHRAPQTFDTKPSGPIGQPGGPGLPPDELMIDWGNIPKGAVASLYWPAVSATEVIMLIRQWGRTAKISASDAHTLNIPIEGGTSYIPIPSGNGQNFAGLLTLELPLGIRTGQQFEVLIRRVSAQIGEVVPPPPTLQSGAPLSARAQRGRAAARTSTPAKRSHALSLVAPRIDDVNIGAQRPPLWRRVVGSFAIRIPVSTSTAMLAPEGTVLAFMKWRLEQMSPSDRWVPVLERYIAYCSARYNAVGGNADQVPPSLTWVPPGVKGGKDGSPGGKPGEHVRCGRVAEVLFDCHGSFSGFVLDECCARQIFTTREHAIGELVLLACRKRLRLCVTVDEACGRIVRLAVTG